MAIPGCSKICALIAAATFLIFIIAITTLSRTIFNPTQPNFTVQVAGLENFHFNRTFPYNITLHNTLKVVVTVDNPNYVGLEYWNSKVYLHYQGDVIAEVPIDHKLILARSKVNGTMEIEVYTDKLISNPSFWGGLSTGWLNLTSTETLHGKIIVMNILKMHATVSNMCNISIFMRTQKIKLICKSRMRL
ncbi:hypothetical protein SAY86_022885 [Trapa natans]|uniref:Late embryogenesis abundant protein LEA-2 subgroup domain-containing protein n=1 Tax=Trapa natans TaxID=22666 RepID=A0AAN7LU72_TRANT|nr:hypothetical protein SAY86_022885 [Trapa natans]